MRLLEVTDTAHEQFRMVKKVSRSVKLATVIVQA
jgi:hypothetical protein